MTLITWPRGGAFLFLRWSNGTLIPVNFGRSHVIRASSADDDGGKLKAERSQLVNSSSLSLSLSLLLSQIFEPSPREDRGRFVLVSIYSTLLPTAAFFVVALQDNTTAINVPRNEAVLLALTNVRKLRTHASRTLSLLIFCTSTYSRRDVSFSFCLSLSSLFLFVWIKCSKCTRGIVVVKWSSESRD